MGTSHHFYRKLHSLLGIIPIGLFLIVHFVVNYMAIRGPEAYNNSADFLENLPFLVVLEWGLIFLPLLYHGIYGLFIVWQAENNTVYYSYFNNIKFFIHRLTGVITFIFVTWHVYETSLQVKLGNEELNFLLMKDILENNYSITLYLIGVISAIFHFCNGIWSFLISWGITIGPRSQRISNYIFMTSFIIISVVAVFVLFSFRGGII